jgi:hypothetical protein
MFSPPHTPVQLTIQGDSREWKG